MVSCHWTDEGMRLDALLGICMHASNSAVVTVLLQHSSAPQHQRFLARTLCSL